MDPNNKNPNIDGIKANEPQPSTANMDGFVSQPRPSINRGPQGNNDINTPEAVENANYEQPSQQDLTTQPTPKSGKGLKITIIVFVVLFAVAAAAAAMLYIQNGKYEDELSAEKQKSAQLQKQVDELNQSSSTQEIEKLTTENANLQKTINSLNSYIESLTKVAQELKTKCGSACDTITIPVNPTASGTNTNSTTPTVPTESTTQP